MRRTAAVVLLVLVTAIATISTVFTGKAATTAAAADPAPVLPAGFHLVDYPTGQAGGALTNFAWLADNGLLTSGKDGTVTYVPPGGSPRTIGHVPNVRAVGDHGMLGFALAPDYATTGHVYITYDQGDPPGTGNGTGYGMVEEWMASPAAAPTTFTRVRTILDGSTMSPALAQTTINHGVDTLVVAPDGTLFVSVGDDSMNNGGPETLRAQDITLPYGKVLHLTTDGNGVASNPFYQPASPHSWQSMVYAYGFRNPFRFGIDPKNGILQLGDVGWNTWEEVDSVTAGMNAGWPCYEADSHTSLGNQALCQSLYTAGTATGPITTYKHNGSGASVVGGMDYTGTSYPAAYRGAWFYGDYTRNLVWTLTTDQAGHLVRAPENPAFASSAGAPVAFHPGPGDDVTYADIAAGRVRRLEYTSGNRDPVAQLDTSVDPDTRTVTFSAAGSYDPDGDTLTYDWDLGDGTISHAVSVTHTYANADARTITLTVHDQSGGTGTATTVVHPSNHDPVITLTAPPASKTFAVGDPVQLSATATDPEDGDLTVHWTSALKHCPFAESCHLHPEGPQTGPTFVDSYPDHTFDTTLLVTVSATDSDGATTTETWEGRPTLHTVTVSSPVPVAINGVVATSAQAVENSQVELSAPTTSTYQVFKSWSDGGTASHAFTMPTSDVSLTAVYQTAIEQRYAALGGASSFLGNPKAAEYSTAGAGRARAYAGGKLFWGPTSGAHYLTGAILTAFTGGGGPAKFGLPTTDNTAVTGGEYAHFTGDRSIFHKTGRAAFRLQGPIRAKYQALGYQKSCLGFPTGAQTTITGGNRQSFEHGTITYTTKTKVTTSRCT